MIIAQIFGFCAIGSSFFMYQQRSKKRILIFKLMQDLFWVTHYALLLCGSAAAAQGLCVARELTFYTLGKKEKKITPYIIFFLVLYALSAILTWKSVYSIFPALSALFSTTALGLKNPVHLKLVMIPSLLSTLTYNIMVSHSVSVYIGVTLSMSSIALFFIKNAMKKCNIAKIDLT